MKQASHVSGMTVNEPWSNNTWNFTFQETGV